MNNYEKLALATTGAEGIGEHFVVNNETADKILMEDQARKFNKKVDEYVDKFDKHKAELENYAKTISEDLGGVEIMPMFAYALIQPFDKNPFQQIKVTDSGVITDLGGMSPQYKSNETGHIEESEQFVKVGTVIEVGHKCEFLQPGDIVFYNVASEAIVPFFRQGFVVVNENRIMAVVNSNLTARRDSLTDKK